MAKLKKIIHRKALELKKEPEELSQEEKDELYKKYIKKYKKGRMLIAGILGSLLWFIIIFLCVIFLVADTETGNVNDSLIMAILTGGAILFIIGTIFIIKFFIKIPAKRLKTFAYKSDFLVMGYKKDIDIKGLNESHIYGLAYDEDKCKLMSYGVSHYDVEFIQDVGYFEIVSRYSKNKNPKNLEYCLFVRKEK